MPRSAYLVFSILFLLCPIAEAAAGVLYARRPGTETPVFNLRISHIRTTVDITGQLAVTHVDEEFHNDNHLTLEGFYAFRLPEGAKVDGLWLWVDGQRLIFTVKTKEEAERLYDSVVVGLRRDPAILESLGNNRFQLKVFPINPNSARRIEMRYFHTLPMTPDGHIHYRYPLNMQGYQDVPVELTTLRVNVTSFQEIETLGTNFDDNPLLCRTERLGDFNYRTDFGLENQMYTQDFELSYLPADAFTVFPSLTYVEDDAAQYPYFMCWHPVRIEDEEVPKRDLVFVLDASGSMAGSRIRTVTDAVIGILRQLDEEDRFRIVLFSNRTLCFPDSSSLLPATEAHIEDGIAFIRHMYSPAGMTNYELAFANALNAEFRQDAVRRMLFLTDGLPTAGEISTEGLLQVIESNDPLGVAVYPVIIYSDRIEQLYAIADRRGGRVTMVEDGDDLATIVSRIMLELDIGGILQATVHYEDGNTNLVFPKEFSTLLGIDRLLTTGRLTSLQPTSVRLAFLDGEGNGIEVTRTVDFPATQTNVKQVASWWAAAHIDDLLKQHAAAPDPELRESIINLSIKHQILTPYTAFLVLETNEIDPPVSAAQETPLGLAEQLDVSHNYPNPLSLSSGNATAIPYTLKSAAPVRIVITDLLGRTVRVLEDAVKSGGQHTVLWDGRSDSGDFVSPGMYFVRFHSFGAVMTLRISVIR